VGVQGSVGLDLRRGGVVPPRRAPPVIVATLALVVLLMAVPAVPAATRRAMDREAGVRFTLDGRVLTARVLPRAPVRVRRQLFGDRIRAVCGTNFAFTRGVKVRHTRLWPRGRTRMRYRFRRNISRRDKWCLLEHRRGGDVAFASFG
jgi:hypothetical protein